MQSLIKEEPGSTYTYFEAVKKTQNIAVFIILCFISLIVEYNIITIYMVYTDEIIYKHERQLKIKISS